MENHLDFFKEKKKSRSNQGDGVLLSAISNLKKDRVKKSNLKKSNIKKTNVANIVEGDISDNYVIPDQQTPPPDFYSGSDYKKKEDQVTKETVDKNYITKIVNGIVNNKFHSVKSNYVVKQPQNIIYNTIKSPEQKLYRMDKRNFKNSPAEQKIYRLNQNNVVVSPEEMFNQAPPVKSVKNGSTKSNFTRIPEQRLKTAEQISNESNFTRLPEQNLNELDKTKVDNRLQQSFNLIPNETVKTVKTETNKVKNFILNKKSVINFIDNSFMEPLKTTMVKTINNFNTLPGMELGGIVKTPQTVVVAEKAPEAVIPLEKYNELISKQSMFDIVFNKDAREGMFREAIESYANEVNIRPNIENKQPLGFFKAEGITGENKKPEKPEIVDSPNSNQMATPIAIQEKNRINDEIKVSNLKLESQIQAQDISRNIDPQTNPLPNPSLGQTQVVEQANREAITDESRNVSDPVTRLITKSFDSPKWRSALY